MQRSSTRIFFSVLFALMLRDLKLRFSDTRAGYFWAFTEPALHVLVLSGSYYALGRSTIYNVDPSYFIAIGILPWLIFREGVIGSMNVLRETRGLFDYKQVKPIDAIFAKSLLNTVIYTCVYLTFMLIFQWVDVEAPLFDPLQLMLLLVVIYFLGLGFGILAGVAAALYSEVKRIIKAVVRPMYFISGIFYTIEMIPEPARIYLLWNPVLHASDFIKEAHIKEYDALASWEYLLGVTVVTLTLALMYYRRNATKIFLK